MDIPWIFLIYLLLRVTLCLGSVHPLSKGSQKCPWSTCRVVGINWPRSNNYPADPEGRWDLGVLGAAHNRIPGIRHCQPHKQSVPAFLRVYFWRIPAQVFPLRRNPQEFQGFTLIGQFWEVLMEQNFRCHFS